MARFQQAVRSTNVTSAQAILEIIAGNKGCRVKAVLLTVATAVTGVFGIGRPAAIGVTPTTPAAFAPVDGAGDLSLTKIALAWATSPTSPTTFLHRTSVPGVIGALRDVPSMSPAPQGNVGWFVPAGGTLVLFNITGGPTYDVSVEIDE